MPEGLPILISLVVIATLVLLLIAWCRIFRKADLPWERVFVPVYGGYWQYGIANCKGLFWANLGLNVFSVLLGFLVQDRSGRNTLSIIIFIASLVLFSVYCYRLSDVFGHGIGFTIGLVLLHPIFIMILGFGDSEYYPYGHSSLSHTSTVVTSTWLCSECNTLNAGHRGACENCGKQKPQASDQ